MTDPQNPDVPVPPPGYGSPPPAPTPPAYGQPPYGQPAQPAYAAAPPAPYGAPAAGPTIPGKTMGIVAFILSFFIQLVALILGIVALVQSRKAGHKNGWAVAAIIISSVLLVVSIIVGDRRLRSSRCGGRRVRQAVRRVRHRHPRDQRR